MEAAFAQIPAILKTLGPNEVVVRALTIAVWPKIAGDQLAKHATAVDFENGRLIVAVEDNTWKRNLEEIAPEMLAKLNRKLGDGTVKFIEFRILNSEF